MRIAEFALSASPPGACRNTYRLKGNADGKPRRLSAAQPVGSSGITAHTRVRAHGRDRRCHAPPCVGLTEQFVRQNESSMSVRSSVSLTQVVPITGARDRSADLDRVSSPRSPVALRRGRAPGETRQHNRFVLPSPACAPMCPRAARSRSRSRRRVALSEVAGEEVEHLLPCFGGLRGAVALGVGEVQEGVAGAGVGVELVRLAELGEPGVDLRDVLG
jgi:hypothetical protein